MSLNVESDGLIFNQADLEKSDIEKCDDAILIRMFDAASKATHEEEGMVNYIENHNDSTNKNASLSLNNAQPSNANSLRSKCKGWKVGERCMALFEEDKKYYPARIVKIFQSEKSCEVVYTGYEDSPAIVELKDLLREEEVESAGDSDEKSATVVIGEQPEPMEQTYKQTPRANTIFPIPDLCPPPPPNLLAKVAQAANDKEALSNMLMSWYMAGYHSGYFQGLQKANEKEESS